MMTRRKKLHDRELASKLSTYADLRFLDFKKYSEYHMRLMDGGYTILDFWTTGRYWIMATDYHALGIKSIERGGERGTMQTDDIKGMTDWLDTLFFPEGLDEAN